jgi:hypothetical protein
MKKLYALCLITLLAVGYDVLFVKTSVVKAKGVGLIRVQRVMEGNSASVIDPEIVGFSCVPSTGGQPVPCFIASRN